MKPLVLFDAAPFCFGPASTMQIVVYELLSSEFELMMFTSGTTAEFMSGYDPRCRQVPCDTEQLADLSQHRDLLRRCALFVSNTNPVSARFALDLDVPVLYVDTLFWMWEAIDPVIARRSIYVAQTFVGIEENRRRIGRDIADFRLVGPLVGRAGPRPRNGDCLISFGGMSSKLTIPGVTNRYPWIVTRLLIEAFGRAPSFDRYMFRGSGAVMGMLAREFRDNRFEFSFVPRARHVEEMATARNVLLSPGLTGSYEAINVGAPTWLLPPQNYSQQLQAEVFLDRTSTPFQGRHWRHIYPDLDLPRFMAEADAVARLNMSISRFEDDRSAQKNYVNALAGVLPLPEPASVITDVAIADEAGATVVAAMIRRAVEDSVGA